MKTKIVYVLVSSDNDIYLEQLWASAFSLKHFVPVSTVVVVCDDKTSDRIDRKEYCEFRKLVNEFISIPFPNDVLGVERSRWLKTNLRNLVKGDFLFIDTDTIVTDDLSMVDDFDINIGMATDWHCHLADRPNKNRIYKRVNDLFDDKLKSETEYFNSGVIYSKDTEMSHVFFDKWHERWNEAKRKPMGVQDQQSLMVTVNELGGVSEISGDYNCQPIISMKFLATAKIVHFFNTKWDEYIRSPFYSNTFYETIKKDKGISSKNQYLILNCRSTFISPTMTICGEDIILWRSSSFKFLKKLYNRHKKIYTFVNVLAKRMGAV